LNHDYNQKKRLEKLVYRWCSKKIWLAIGKSLK